MKTKYAILIAAVLIIVSLFAGCKPAATTETQAPAATESKQAEETKATEEEMEPEEMGEPVPLTAITVLFSPDNEFPYPVELVMAEEANVEVTWQVEGFADWGTKKSVILASGDLPDTFFGCPGLTDVDVSSGVFVDWAPLLGQDNTPNIEMFFAEVPEAKPFCTFPDGSIYALPSKAPLRPYSGDVFYVCQPWLDTLGLEAPTTTDEYYDVSMAFVTGDPNGNGIADEIAYTGVGKGPGSGGYQYIGAGALNTFFPAFGVVIANNSLCMVQGDEVVFGPTMEGAKECFIWLNKLYANGLIDPEFFNLDFPTQAAKYRDENYIMVGFGNGWTMQNNVGQYLNDYVLIEPLIGPNGDQYWQSDPYNFRILANTAAISITCENIDSAVKYFDLCFDPWNNLQLAYGSEGIGFELDADGNPTYLAVPEGLTDGEWKFLNGHDAFAPGGVSDAWEATIKGENDSFFKYNADNFYREFFLPESRYPMIKWDQATQDELAILKTDINTYCDTAFVDFVMNGDVEAKWADYLDTLDKMGLPRLMEIYKAGYDENK